MLLVGGVSHPIHTSRGGRWSLVVQWNAARERHVSDDNTLVRMRWRFEVVNFMLVEKSVAILRAFSIGGDFFVFVVILNVSF